MTAVEYLINNSHIVPKYELNKKELIKQAKEMESKQQKFSEEEVNNLISDILYEVRYDYSNIDIIENNIINIFEQFKKSKRCQIYQCVKELIAI